MYPSEMFGLEEQNGGGGVYGKGPLSSNSHSDKNISKSVKKP